MTAAIAPEDPLAQHIISLSPDQLDRAIAFVDGKAYRLHSWSVSPSHRYIVLRWRPEDEMVKAATAPLRWRLEWKLRRLFRAVIA